MEKGRAPAYKLQSDIEFSTDLKGIQEERILDAKIEFTLREALGIAKKDFAPNPNSNHFNLIWLKL